MLSTTTGLSSNSPPPSSSSSTTTTTSTSTVSNVLGGLFSPAVISAFGLGLSVAAYLTHKLRKAEQANQSNTTNNHINDAQTHATIVKNMSETTLPAPALDYSNSNSNNSSSRRHQQRKRSSANTMTTVNVQPSHPRRQRSIIDASPRSFPTVFATSPNTAARTSQLTDDGGDTEEDDDDETSSYPKSSRNEMREMLNELRAMRTDTKKLQEENNKLHRMLTLTESTQIDLEQKNAGPTMSASEIETLRAIFSLFDADNDGSINISEISALHKKLGQPLTEEETSAAMIELDDQGRGSINFDEFLTWWFDSNRGKRKGDKYTARFKFIHAKLTDPDFDPKRLIAKSSGNPCTTEFRIFFKYKQLNGQLKMISPWHDIPLTSVGQHLDGKIFNFICEVPKWTRAKFEIATGEVYNPIKQDVKNGKLRFYKHGDMMFNYGAFPRTWEDPNYIHPDTGFPGDNDPIDVVEIGVRQLPTGSVTQVKVLGVLALIDDRETDWKVIAISISDPLAHVLNDIDDVDVHLPGAIDCIREYLRIYKVCTGAPENTYALRGECMHRDYAIKVVEECHQHWCRLSSRGLKEVSKLSVGALAAIDTSHNVHELNQSPSLLGVSNNYSDTINPLASKDDHHITITSSVVTEQQEQQ